MFWNKKDDKSGLPDLPPIKSPFSHELVPSEQDLNKPEDTQDSQPLPTFPDSPQDVGFSQSAIKDAVADDSPSVQLHDSQDPQKVQEENKEVTASMAPIPQAEEPKASIEETNSELPPRKIKNDGVKETVFDDNDADDDSYQTSIGATTISPRMILARASALQRTNADTPEFKLPNPSPSNPYLSPSTNLSIGLPPEEEEIPKPQPKPAPRPQVKVVKETPLVQKIEKLERPVPPQVPKTDDVFVKIDKFYSAKKTLQSINQQVEQIDSLLKKIRETKLKEERELSVWEKEIFSIKEKIKDVNGSLFEKAQ